MPRILIAGCGYVGQATADLFHRAGWAVEGWTKSDSGTSKPYPIHAIDLTDAKQVHAYEGNFDVIVHCASTRGGDVDLYRRVYLNGARNLLETFATSTMLFTSSTSVYAQTNGERVTEESATETRRQTGQILRETEELVLAHGGIVARLAGIYGPGRSALLNKFLAGNAIIDPETDRFINQVHRDDIAAALFILLDPQRQAKQIYNVVDDRPIRRGECYRWLAKKLNRPLPPVEKSAARGKRGDSSKCVSNAKLRGLGWTPRYPTFAEAMEKSILPSFGHL
ncbi:MAG TPA: NAD-dependent epimerase/dehydratase family protein [Candidatus Udaeobacter sp.]|jgi:nucleoside-diphosphate-sugar epimerase